MTVSYRHPARGDLEVITSVMNQSRRETLYHRDLTADEVNAETFDDPDYDLEGAWLAFDGDSPVGYAIGVVEESRIEAGLDDGIVEVDVVPDRRGEGIEEELVRRALGYLKSRQIGHATARIEETETWKETLHLRLGFRKVRHFYRLAWRGKATLPHADLPSGVEITRTMLGDLTDSQLEVLTDVLNDSFAGHFEFAPQPLSRMARWRSVSEDPFMVTMAIVSSETIAFCVTEDSRTYNAERGVSSGWIDLLGVRKAHRGRGIGTALLIDGMTWLTDLGHDTVFIGVDADNENALGLYLRLGFEIENMSRAYHQDLNSGPSRRQLSVTKR